jgi:hypothetical protein
MSTFTSEFPYPGGPRRVSPQPYYGPLYDQGTQTMRALEPWLRNIGRVGQLNPTVQEKFNVRHGRFLSGLGGPPALTPDGSDPRYRSGHLKRLEGRDDVYGSGIFDGPEGKPTANAEMGIFSSEYSLPGYVGREVPFAVSRDITDITDGGAVVMVPAGGKAVIEDGGHHIPPPVLGPTQRAPALTTPQPTPIDQVYVDLQPDASARPPLNQYEPQRPMPSYAQPSRNFLEPVTPLPWSPPGRRIPFTPPERVLPYRATFNPLGAATFADTPWTHVVAGGLIVGASLWIAVKAYKQRKG